ncbi:MAG: DUF4136 domain-containing protein [Cytophagaceae bacterium]|nr:DUF4136 domain-containing protein [Cytophagaceae bacterium]
MKKVWFVCAVGLALASCAGRQTLTDGKYPVQRPIVAEPATFALMDGQFESWDPALNRESLHREADRQLRLRGYRLLDYGPGLQPDLLVYCSVYAEPLRLPQVRTLDKMSRGGTPQNQRYWQPLKAGSVVIQVFDTRWRRIVWSGYADGLREGDWAADDRLLTQAAQAILEEYHAVAPAVLARNKKGAE